MKLSVIVPAFKLEQYIEPCLRSVLEQTVNFDYEVIVCDDASPDNTAAVIQRLENVFPHLRAIYKTQNGGLANNMKTLLSSAQGEYIAYLDGDDIALPGKLQKQVDYLDSHLDCQMVYHESDMFDSDTNASIKLYSQQHYNWQHVPARSGIEHLIRYGTYLQASAVMFRRHDHLVDSVLADCKIILDYPFYILNAGFLNASIDFMPEVLGRYRIHSQSFGAQTQRSSERREQSLNDIIAACQAASQFGVAKEIIDAGIAHHQFAAALYFLFREQDALFTRYICASAANGDFFNERHALAFEHHQQPQKVRELLA